MTLTEEIAEIIGQKRLGGYSDMVAAEAVVELIGWRPIDENTPRKGRSLILLLTPSLFPQVAYANTWWTAGFSVENKPTHWAPLPEPPARKERDDG